MSEISDSIQAKCLAFGDRIIKLNDYLLEQAANKKPGYKMVNGKRVYNKSIPVHLQAVSNLCNQLLRAGTSIGANNAEACNAVPTMLKHVTPLAKQISSPKVLLLLKKHGNLYIGLTCFIAIATWTINNTKAYTMMLKN